VRDPDVVIGTGIASPKELLSLKSFGIVKETKMDIAKIKAKTPFVKPIDPAITCVSETNAYAVSYSLVWHGAINVSYVDRSLVLAYSQNCRNALVISEEHEFSNMPAQLTITPIINFTTAREHEKLVEIYYGRPEDDDYLNQLVDTIRNIVKEVGGAQKIDSKILFSHEEETAQESFLFMRGEKLEAKLKSCGLTVVSTTTNDVLEGAEIFSHSEFYDNSVIYSKTDDLRFF
jgi:hypothetical protein